MGPYVDTSAAREGSEERAAARRDQAGRWTVRRLLVPLLALGVGFVGIVVAQRSGSGATSVDVRTLDVGACFAEAGGVSVTPIGCTEPHDGEKVGEVAMPAAAAAWSEAEAQAHAYERCRIALEQYVDAPALGTPGALMAWLPDALVGQDDGVLASCTLEYLEPVASSAHRPGGARGSLLFLTPPACVDWAEPQAASQFVVNCAGPHDAQLIVRRELSTTSYPGQESLAGVGEQFCPGTRADDLEAGMVARAWTPSAEEWQAGYRAVLCLVESADGSPLTGALS